MSSTTVIKAGCALSTMAISHANAMAPKVVFSDFATRILPTLTSSQPKAEAPRQKVMTKSLFHNETPLDPRDFGYRVVAAAERPPLYTSTDVSAQPESCATTSTLGQIVCSDECAAEEVLAAQEEWDNILDMEPTRPHFEYYKEDPYNVFESSAAQDLFSFIDSHETEEDVWEAAA